MFPYMKESGDVAVLINGVQQIGLFEEQPAGRGARDGVIGDDGEGVAVEVRSAHGTRGTTSNHEFLGIIVSSLDREGSRAKHSSPKGVQDCGQHDVVRPCGEQTSERVDLREVFPFSFGISRRPQERERMTQETGRG